MTTTCTSYSLKALQKDRSIRRSHSLKADHQSRVPRLRQRSVSHKKAQKPSTQSPLPENLVTGERSLSRSKNTQKLRVGRSFVRVPSVLLSLISGCHKQPTPSPRPLELGSKSTQDAGSVLYVTLLISLARPEAHACSAHNVHSPVAPRRRNLNRSCSHKSRSVRLAASICSNPTGTMWDDEDNNPYGSFERRDSNSDVNPSSPEARMSNEDPAIHATRRSQGSCS